MVPLSSMGVWKMCKSRDSFRTGVIVRARCARYNEYVTLSKESEEGFFLINYVSHNVIVQEL